MRGEGGRWREQKRGSRVGNGDGEGGGIIRLRETEVRPRYEDKVWSGSKLLKGRKFGRIGMEARRVHSRWLGSHWRNLTGTVDGATEFANSRNTFKRANGASSLHPSFQRSEGDARTDEREKRDKVKGWDGLAPQCRAPFGGMAFSTTGRQRPC